ncbi:MAG: hypothetical protein EA401_01210 [Planctomycetota bacterium]|nr:MAG: hypothetical protein EA401_01210 [Planctomycetota bacterium]
MRLLLSILLGSVTAMAWATEKPALTRYTLDDLDPAVKAEVERALQEADRARVAYLQAIQRANEAAVQRIDRQIQAQTRRGNLDGALAARQMVEMLNEGWLKAQAEAEFDMLGNQVVNREQALLQSLHGKWVKEGTSLFVEFLPSGNYSSNFHMRAGTFTVDVESQTVTLKNEGNTLSYVLANNVLLEGQIRWNKQ